VVACGASAAVLAVAVLVGYAATPSSAPADVAVSDQPTVAGRAGGGGGKGGADDERTRPGPHEPLLLPMAHAELLPDGTVERLPVAEDGDAPRGSAVRLPDGRLVTLASRDLLPGVEREDGALVEGLAFVLAVFDADGELLGERDVRRMGENVSIAGARGDQVVLVRSRADGNCCGSLAGVAVSTIDPTTFEEAPIAEIDRLPGIGAAAGDRLVLVDDGTTGATATTGATGTTGPGGGAVPECRVTLVDLATGESGDVATLPCIGLTAVSISPDGERAAVVIDRRAGITVSAGTDVTANANALGSRQDILDQAVVFVSLDDGEVLGSERFDIAPTCSTKSRPECPAVLGAVEYRGLGWVDDDHVELVVQDPDPRPDPPVIELGELVPERLRTLAVEIDTG
jgi:hypothetical protein